LGETVNILVMVPGCIQNRETHAYGFRARESFLFVLDRGIILSFWLFLSNLLLGAGLAMDAFSVSLAICFAFCGHTTKHCPHKIHSSSIMCA